MIKRLLKSVREFKKDALLTPFFVVLEVVMEVIIPMVMALLIDKGIDGQDMAAIWKYGIILVLCAMLALVFGAAAGTFAARASTGFARNLRHDMYYNVQNFSFSNIDKFSTGSIVTRLTTDVTNVQNAFQMCTRIAVRCPVMLVFALFMAMKINPKKIGSQCRLKVIDPILLVGNRTPTGRRDMWLIRSRNTEWHRYIPHYAQYTGDCYFRIGSLWYGMYIE